LTVSALSNAISFVDLTDADIGHIFSLVIDVNDKEVINDTSTKTYVDAMVPVPDRWAQTHIND
jgi:hypothetical protein